MIGTSSAQKSMYVFSSVFHAISTDGCGLVNGPIIAWIVNPSASMESSDPDPVISLYPAIAFENTAQFLLRCLKGAHPTECSSSISCIFGGNKSTCEATPDLIPLSDASSQERAGIAEPRSTRRHSKYLKILPNAQLESLVLLEKQ